MIPANTTVTCPSCDGEFEVEYDMLENEIIECDNCDVELILIDGDLRPLEEEHDIYQDDDDEDEEEDNPQRPIGSAGGDEK
jgi:hypothetical protein